MERFLPYTPLLLEGLKVTLAIYACAAVVSVTFAIFAGVVRFGGPAWLRWPVTAVVEFLRGTSCFVQLFWCFYALPMLGVTLTPFVTSVIVLGLNSGSFGSEVVRGALEAVPKGQTEAARALSYSPFRIFVHVLAPQAARIAIRPAANLLVDLLKLTPLTSLVTVSDLTRNAMIMRTQTGSTIVTLLVIFAIYFLLASLIYAAMNRLEARLHRGAGMTWDNEFALSILPLLLKGFLLTLKATAGGTVLALILGLVLALCAYAPQRALRQGAHAVTELLRRTPLLVHIYILFFALPELGLVLSPLTAGILALGLHTGSYMSAVYQSGINAVPAGQWEAARSLGYSRRDLWARIVLPQAVPMMIPALGNYILLMFKESAILSVIAVPEAMQTALSIGNKTYRYFEAVTVVGLLYLAISLPVAAALRGLERRYVTPPQ